MSDLADEYFKSFSKTQELEGELEDALTRAVGYEPDTRTVEELKVLPFTHITFDWYDYSFEFKSCKIGWKPIDEQINACIDLGFNQCWICYTDGSEWYYSKKYGWNFQQKRGE
jgi:hypothetical protein